MENECKALPGVAYPGVRDNRSTINTKTGYDDDDDDETQRQAVMSHWPVGENWTQETRTWGFQRLELKSPLRTPGNEMDFPATSPSPSSTSDRLPHSVILRRSRNSCSTRKHLQCRERIFNLPVSLVYYWTKHFVIIKQQQTFNNASSSTTRPGEPSWYFVVINQT